MIMFMFMFVGGYFLVLCSLSLSPSAVVFSCLFFVLFRVYGLGFLVLFRGLWLKGLGFSGLGFLVVYGCMVEGLRVLGFSFSCVV